jgi:hypothetical protein
LAKLKNRIQISNSVDKVIWANFQKLSEQTRIPIARLLDEAMEDLLKKYQSK